MYSTPHATVGLAITSTTLLTTQDMTLTYSIGIPLAVVSHYMMDYLRESNLKENTLLYDIIPYILYTILGYLSGYFWLFFFSGIAGNLLDVIDKKLYFAIVYSKYRHTSIMKKLLKYKLFQWASKPSLFFHRQKTGINFSLNQTKASAIISLIITIFFTIILSKTNPNLF